jgi:hypothetical protein
MLYFSASSGGFYDDQLHATLPGDAVKVSRERHGELLCAQSAGLMIVADGNGAPVAVPRPGPTPADMGADLRKQRDALLTASDWTQMPDAPLTKAERDTWRAYRKALRDLPATTPDLAAVVWPVAPA